MAKPGPRPTPTRVLELRGSWRAKSRPQEPIPVAEKPACPTWLDADSKKLWKRVSAELSPMGILARVDGNALARYVSMLATWQRLVIFLQEHGDTCPIYKQTWVEAHDDAEGHLVAGHHELVTLGEALRPQVTLLFKIADRLLQLEAHFGMTPSSRASIGIELARAAMPKPTHPLGDSRRFLRLDRAD